MNGWLEVALAMELCKAKGHEPFCYTRYGVLLLQLLPPLNGWNGIGI
jgi:hypothetical protein